MNDPFESTPFSRMPMHLRSWFSSIVDSLKRLPAQELQTVQYPEGTSFEESFVMSESLNTLFHARIELDRQRHIPVSAEFIWKD